jgi:5-methylcytosine-specific restriction endonuclease McrA
MKQLNLFKAEPLQPEKKKLRHWEIPLGSRSPAIGYKEYIDSKYWAKKRLFAIQHLGTSCNRCQKLTSYPEVHHKDYESLYFEHLSDVEVLCPRCHDEADKDREYRTAYETYCEKKYGPNWVNYNYDTFRAEFDEWYSSVSDTV